MSISMVDLSLHVPDCIMYVHSKSILAAVRENSGKRSSQLRKKNTKLVEIRPNVLIGTKSVKFQSGFPAIATARTRAAVLCVLLLKGRKGGDIYTIARTTDRRKTKSRNGIIVNLFYVAAALEAYYCLQSGKTITTIYLPTAQEINRSLSTRSLSKRAGRAAAAGWSERRTARAVEYSRRRRGPNSTESVHARSL